MTRGDAAKGRTLATMLEDSAGRWPDKSAVVFPDSAVTYRELVLGVRSAAAGLLALGLQPGARVAIWLPNCVEWVQANLAAASVGAITVPMNMRYRVEDASYILEQSAAEVLVMAGHSLRTDYARMLAEICPQLVGENRREDAATRARGLRHVFCISETDVVGIRRWSELADIGRASALADVEARMKAISPDDVCHIQYTSGTTSRPKGAMVTHRKLLRSSFEVCDAMRSGQTDTIFSPLPFYHVAGYVAALLAALQAGGTIVSTDRFDAEESLQLIARERCTIIRGVETMFIMMMAHPRFGEYDISALRGGVCGSNSVEVVRDVQEKMGIRELVSVYGLSETTGASTMTRTDDSLETRILTQGKPLPGVEIRILDSDSGGAAREGQPGEIAVRGWNTMNGYYNKPLETADAIDVDGWLHTGDLGLIDRDGNLRFIDRIKDVIRVGGENVSAAEVESFLFRHPKVEQVQVVAGPDMKLNQICVAYVKTKEGTACSEAEIVDFCIGQLASFKVPRHVFFVDEFPVTASGKVQKVLLRERAKADLELERGRTLG